MSRRVPVSAAPLLLALCVCLASVSATQPPPQPFRTTVELVSIPVTVEGKSGRVVTGLAKEHFSIVEDGVRQEIAVFSNEPQPIALAVLVDFSRSMQGERRQAALAAVAELGRALNAQDQWSLFTFADRTALVKGWGPAEPADLKAFASVASNGGTRLFQGVIDVQPALGQAPHRKRAMLLISDGNDISLQIGDDASLEGMSHLDASEKRAVNALRTGEALLYAFGMDWPYQPTSRRGVSPSARVNRRALQALSAPTGGKLWTASTASQLRDAARQLTDELRQQYTLGYTHSKAHDGKYRRIRVTVSNSEYRVRSRQGYLARKP